MDFQTLHPFSRIDRDCTLILDAVRRLKGGTWQLRNEDADWAEHLLPLIKEALTDHIEYENTCVLPELSANLAQEHSTEHNRILALLSALDESRQKKDAIHFVALLDLLLETLDQHHLKFGCGSATLSACSNQSAKERIIKRAEGSNLECK